MQHELNSLIGELQKCLGLKVFNNWLLLVQLIARAHPYHNTREAAQQKQHVEYRAAKLMVLFEIADGIVLEGVPLLKVVDEEDLPMGHVALYTIAWQ